MNGRWVVWFNAVGMALLLLLIVVTIIRGGPNHEDILERQQGIESQLVALTCIVQLVDPTSEAIAECQVRGG